MIYVRSTLWIFFSFIFISCSYFELWFRSEVKVATHTYICVCIFIYVARILSHLNPHTLEMNDIWLFLKRDWVKFLFRCIVPVRSFFINWIILCKSVINRKELTMSPENMYVKFVYTGTLCRFVFVSLKIFFFPRVIHTLPCAFHHQTLSTNSWLDKKTNKQTIGT